MGSFNVLCMISNLPISGGDLIYVIPLQTQQYQSLNNLCEYSHKIVGVPFLAKYTDSSHYESVKSSPTNSKAEKYFYSLLSVKNSKEFNEKWNFINGYNVDDNTQYTVAYVHKHIYEKLGKYSEEFADTTAYHSGFNFENYANTIGFTLDESTDMYTHGVITALTRQYGQYGKFFFNDEHIRIYSLHDLAEFFDEKLKTETDSITILKYNMFINTLKNTDAFKESYCMDTYLEWLYLTQTTIDKNSFCYKMLLSKYKYRDMYTHFTSTEMSTMFHFIAKIQHLCIIFTPVRYAGQEQNKKQYIWLNKVIKEQLKKG